MKHITIFFCYVSYLKIQKPQLNKMQSNIEIKVLSSKKTRTKKKGRKNKSKVVDVEIEIEDDIQDDIEDDIQDDIEGETIKKCRSRPTRESVLESFDNIITCVENEIQNLREGAAKIKGVKFLRSLNKNLKNVRTKAGRVMKTKKKTTRVNSENSGFKKPVSISKDLASFAGWNPEDLRSRVDVTKYICNYIKTHDLQNPDDRRQIQPDAKLQKLLGFSTDTETEPLRYYSLQTYLKPHFPKK